MNKSKEPVNDIPKANPFVKKQYQNYPAKVIYNQLENDKIYIGEQDVQNDL